MLSLIATFPFFPRNDIHRAESDEADAERNEAATINEINA